MFNIFAVRPDLVTATASWIPHLIARADNARGASVSDMLNDCVAEKAVFWIVEDTINSTPVGVVFTRIVTRFGERGIDIMLVGGVRGLEWAPALRKRMHEYREAENAQMLLAPGRKGWGRVLGMTPYEFADGLWLFEDYA